MQKILMQVRFLIWKNPVRPGDTLSGTLEILESKISKSRPEIGFVKYKTELTNQDSKQVFFTESTLIIKSKKTPAKIYKKFF